MELDIEQMEALLDNNIAERAIKMAIRYGKNSMFYKTQRGASVGDIYMSLTHTLPAGEVRTVRLSDGAAG